MKIRRILVPVDFSEASDAVVKYASDLASQLGASIVVIHVVEPIPLAGPGYRLVNGPLVAAEQVRAAEGAMAGLLARLKKRSPTAKGLVVSGLPHQMILDAVGAKKVDLIVMGTHGRGGARRLLIGSVAEKVVRAANCPVISIRGGEASRKPSRKTRARKKKAA